MNELIVSGRFLADIGKEADQLSLNNQKSYINCLRLLASIGMAMVAAFLFYDELDLVVMIFIYALLMIAGGLILYYAKKKQFHTKYINYRLLAEVIRVQNVFFSAGIEKNVAEYFSYTMRDDTEWIWEIIENSAHNTKIFSFEELKNKWLLEQYNYHTDAEKKTRRKLKVNNRISNAVKIAVIVIVVIACLIEFIPSIDVHNFIGTITLKGYVLIVVGLLSAISLFLASYYGKQNLERKISDHVEMAKLYSDVISKIEVEPLTKEIIENTAREEILENGNWYSYMKNNMLTLDF